LISSWGVQIITAIHANAAQRRRSVTESPLSPALTGSTFAAFVPISLQHLQAMEGLIYCPFVMC